MTDREKLITWIRDTSKFHEEVKEKWILGGKQGERPSLIESIADYLIANGVVVREKGEWKFSEYERMRWCTKAVCSRCKSVIANNVHLSEPWGAGRVCYIA